jgi:hypothetical protein
MKLSASQLQQLGIAATAAFKRLDGLDLLELPADVATCTKSERMTFWRQRECANVTGICSFRELDSKAHYVLVHDHFAKIAGLPLKGRDKSATRAALLREMWDMAREAGLGDGYIATICHAKKFGHANVEQLLDWQVEQLHHTIVNRARAKLGRGHTAARNKSQRQAREENREQKESKGRDYALKPAGKYTPKPKADDIDDNEPF